MSNHSGASRSENDPGDKAKRHHLRFHYPHRHLAAVFGSDWFGQKAEAFARYFGTPYFLVAQTAIVVLWILANGMGVVGFDIYPFILLNLAFSLQAAYAAPLILLAQTRQADRDKANAEADAQHREEIAAISARRQELMSHQGAQLLALLEQNNRLTELSHQISQRIEALTREVHSQLMTGDKRTSQGADQAVRCGRAFPPGMQAPRVDPGRYRSPADLRDDANMPRSHGLPCDCAT